MLLGRSSFLMTRGCMWYPQQSLFPQLWFHAVRTGKKRQEENMKYDNIVEGIFLERPNRFTAYVELGGRRETVHVKNTGRCRELLKEGAPVYLQESDNPERKTRYDLTAVVNDGQIINIDSQAPNRAVQEWLFESGFFGSSPMIRPEYTYGNSRFDFYIESGERKIFLEVKGVTLKEDRTAAFPDAPSERAVKHLRELVNAGKKGYEAYVLFVIQMKQIDCIIPNEKAQPEFAEALREAEAAGVHILAYDCVVERDGMRLDRPVPVRLYPEAVTLSGIVKPLLAWYDASRRILPWREEPAPYRVWVSEIMLQQTRVEAVKPYFERFMAALPDIQSLAEVEEETLLKLWEGLGYYNRARNLKKAAIQIEEQYAGRMPDTYEELTGLAGIGSYTAGAIASIAYGKKVPAVDGNVLRVVMRLLADASDISDARVKKKVEKWLAGSMSEERPGDFNQAMMEIGAVVCLPNGAPKCEECPLKQLCRAYALQTMTEFPVKAPKKARTVEKKTVLMLMDAEKTAVHKRPDKGLLAGLYEFPSLPGFCTEEEILSYLDRLGLKAVRIRPLVQYRHIFSHREWHMKGWYIRVDELERAELSGEGKDFLFVDAKRMEQEIPIPSAFAPFVERMREEALKEGRGKRK